MPKCTVTDPKASFTFSHLGLTGLCDMISTCSLTSLQLRKRWKQWCTNYCLDVASFLIPSLLDSYLPSNKAKFLLLQRRKSQHQLYLHWIKSTSTWLRDITFQGLVSYCHSLNNLACQSTSSRKMLHSANETNGQWKLFSFFPFPNQEEEDH